MRYSKSYRVLRLYTWLEQKKQISLSGTAVDFGIDERTVQRDIADIRAFLDDRSGYMYLVYISTKITVILSFPPFSLAFSTRLSTAFSIELL